MVILKYLFKHVVGVVLITLITTSQFQAMEILDPGSVSYPEIQKINDSFYVGKIKDKDLWLVMERVGSEDARQLWLKYIKIQNIYSKNTIRTTDGIDAFEGVINTVNIKINETWVTYITTNNKPQPITDQKEQINSYYSKATNENTLRYDAQQFPYNILMFVTITSSPNARLMTPLGISTSVAGVIYNNEQNKKAAGISLDLLSFAAKVMLMRKPDRKYMINAPVPAMEKIIIQGLPEGSVFAGTREMKRISDEWLDKNRTMDNFKRLHPEKPRQEILEIQDEISELTSRYKLLKKYENELESAHEKAMEAYREELLQDFYPEEIDNIIAEGKFKNRYEGFKQKFEEDPKNHIEFIKGSLKKREEVLKKVPSVAIDNNGLVTFDKEKVSEFVENEAFKNYIAEGSDSGFASYAKDLKWNVGTLDNLLEKYPPLLSVDGENGREIRNEFTVYDRNDPQKPWLIDHHSEDYDWMYRGVFQTKGQGSMHFIMVDLENLAHSKKLDIMR